MTDLDFAASVMKLYADLALFFALMMQSSGALVLAVLAQTAGFWLRGYFRLPVVSAEHYTRLKTKFTH